MTTSSSEFHLIFGPPGCGKTTTLLDVLAQEVARGVDVARIAYSSFTRKAVREAADRLGAGKDETPWFKTLHSTAYAMLGLRRDDVMTAAQEKEFAAGIGYTFSTHMDAADGWGETRGDMVRATYDAARATGRTIEQQLHVSGVIGIEAWEVRRYAEELRHFKSERGLVDFADMLDCGGTCPVDVAIIDEAQDLTPAQWRFALSAYAGAQRIYVAGDDDQAIYGWAGADPARFINLPGTRRILTQSWRVPSRVHRLAGRIAGRIRQRVSKDWQPREELGVIRRVGHVELLPIDEPGTWLLLARNTYLLQQYTHWLRREGIVYSTAAGSSIKRSHAAAITAWEAMRRGREADVVAALELTHYDEVPANPPPWFDALDRIPITEREYYRAAMRRGQKLVATPRVHVSTIHGIKGGEADHVALLPDMAARSYRTADSDEEHRVWYVGATRARKSLFLLDADSMMNYPLAG